MDSGELEYIQNSVHRDAVILHQLAPNRERIKLLNLSPILTETYFLNNFMNACMI